MYVKCKTQCQVYHEHIINANDDNKNDDIDVSAADY